MRASAWLAVSLGSPFLIGQPATPRPPTLHVDSVVGPVDAPLHVSVSGLASKQLVRITTTSRTPTDRALIAYGVFRADESGSIDLSSAKPIEGTYSKPDSMGLFWSMTPQAVPVEVWPHLELPPRHPPQPWNVLLEVAPEEGGEVLATVKLVRLFAGEGVRSVEAPGCASQCPSHGLARGQASSGPTCREFLESDRRI